MLSRLVDRVPNVAPERLVDDLVPPPHFADVRFETYRPDPAQPTQAHAVERLRRFAADVRSGPRSRSGMVRLLRRPAAGATRRPGVYLDGGFGVGKTHLLASLWHAAPAPKAFGTFVELTNLVGALGFADAVTALSDRRLVCIDEFELDDPGDTVLMSSFLGRLAEAGVRLAATSNTLPGSLGDGRFAADDFLREIQVLSDQFEVITIDGDDYRHRGLPAAPAPHDDAAVNARAHAEGAGATLDDFDALLAHLSRLHPSRYGALLDGVDTVYLRGVHPVRDQSVALRLVVLADRLYDRDVPLTCSGAPLDQVFPDELMRGGYRKKYARAVSRLVALARQADDPAAVAG